MAKNAYVIGVDVPGTKEEVWATIADVKSYPNWTSILSLLDNDEVEIGKQFNVVISKKGRTLSQFKATLIGKEEYHFFSARQTMLGRWFFSATHHFIVEENNGQVRFIQSWDFTGVLYGLFKKQIFKLLDVFKIMNEELRVHMQKQNQPSITNN